MDTVQLQPLTGRGRSARSAVVHFGSWTVEAPIEKVGPGEWAMPAGVLKEFSLTPGRRVGAWTSPDGRHVHLGPVMGVAIDGSSDGFDSPRVAGLMAELEESAREAGVVVFFFSIWDVDLRSGRVSPISRRGSPARVAPVPDVLYNRGTYKDISQRRRARLLRTRMQTMFDTVPVNSADAFGKWATYEALRFFGPTRNVMPPTGRVRTTTDVLRFLSLYRTAFLKEDAGSWGRNVVRIDAPSASVREYRLTGYLNGRGVDERWPHASALRRFLLARCREGVWLMQRAIRRRKLLDRVFDFRVVMQKGSEGAWHIPHVLVNWAHPGEVVTNRPETSAFMSLQQFARHWRDGDGDAGFLRRAVDAVEDVSHIVADVLETRFGSQGEIGLDIGVDERARPWLFEANAKPYFMPGEGTRHPVQYAQYVAERMWRAKYEGVAGRPQVEGKKELAAPC